METLGIQPIEPLAPQTWRGKDVLLISAASLVLVLLGALGAGLIVRLFFQKRSPESDLITTLALVGVEFVALMVSVYFFGLRRRQFAWRTLGFRSVSWSWLVIAFALWLVSRIVAILVSVPIDAALNIKQNPQIAAIAPAGFTWLGLVGMTLLGGVAVPIAEEIFFRGVLYRWLRSRWGVGFSLGANALVFGLAHVDLAVIPSVIILGLAIAYVYEKSNSLWPGIFIHAFNNAFSIILLYVLLAAHIPLQ